jgi:hypothetical protein
VSDREPYLIQLSERLVPLIRESSPPELTAPERVFVYVWEVEAEVNNGGFHQYHFNSSGDLALEAAAAFDAIGAPLTANIVRAANEIFPNSPPRDRSARQDALDSIGEVAFDELDSRFYAYAEDLSSLLYAYVQQHKAEIRGA